MSRVVDLDRLESDSFFEIKIKGEVYRITDVPLDTVMKYDRLDTSKLKDNNPLAVETLCEQIHDVFGVPKEITRTLGMRSLRIILHEFEKFMQEDLATPKESPESETTKNP